MSSHDDALSLTRRRFMQSAARSTAAFAASSAMVNLLTGCAQQDAPKTSRGQTSGGKKNWALAPAIDPNTGKALLKLPPGFSYFSFAWAGEPLAGGGQVPGAADGMGLIRYQANKASFIRNQEIWEDVGAYAELARAYDRGAGGGAVNFEVDLSTGKLTAPVRASLTGSCANCSGGVTPWQSWLSGEEQVIDPKNPIASRSGRLMDQFERVHGYMFEVPWAADGNSLASSPNQAFSPIVEMGCMRHEAAAIDAKTGAIYLTEDNEPEAGLYRFTPRVPGQLQQGGKLEVLAVQSGMQEFRRQVPRGRGTKTHWVEIADPSRGHADQQMLSNGCFLQGKSQGAVVFTRLEGIYLRQRELFFTATNGGDIGQGQVFVLNLDSGMLELVYESEDKLVMNFPDAIHNGPDGGHIICQDGKEVFPQVLYYLSKSGQVRAIAQNNASEDQGNAYYSEWSGCSMSPDGKWLFANVYTPGYSVAITGPFEEWAKAV